MMLMIINYYDNIMIYLKREEAYPSQFYFLFFTFRLILCCFQLRTKYKRANEQLGQMLPSKAPVRQLHILNICQFS